MVSATPWFRDFALVRAVNRRGYTVLTNGWQPCPGLPTRMSRGWDHEMGGGGVGQKKNVCDRTVIAAQGLLAHRFGDARCLVNPKRAEGCLLRLLKARRAGDRHGRHLAYH